MKNIMLMLIACMYSICIFSNRIIYREKNAIILFDVEKQIILDSIKLDKSDKYLAIASITENTDSIVLLVYNIVEYRQFNFEKVLHDREYLVQNDKFSFIASNTIWLQNGLYNCKTTKKDGSIKSKIISNISFTDRYKFQTNNKLGSESGNVYIQKQEQKEIILQSKINNGTLCGYYYPDLSSDGKTIICVYECSQYKRKKVIGKTHLIEYNILNKGYQPIDINGTLPKYSRDSRYILIRVDDGFVVFKRSNKKLFQLKSALEAYWIR